MSNSPTAPRITLSADNSQIKMYTKCPYEWYLSKICNLQKKGPINKNLDKGSIFHCLLDFYYKRIALGESRSAAYQSSVHLFQQGYKEKLIPTDLTKEELLFLLDRFYAYHSYWSLNNDYRPAVIDGVPQVEIGFSVPLLDNATCLYVSAGFFVDHKSQSRTYEYYNFDSQWLTYGLAVGCTKCVTNYVGLQQKIDQNTFRRVANTFSLEKLLQYKQYLIDTFHRMAYDLQRRKFRKEFTACARDWGKVCQYADIDEQTDPEGQLITINTFYTTEKERFEPWKLEIINQGQLSEKV